ncbi:MAG: hypothetical protein WC356_04805 [Candidatus Micrarchaeia archaeon]
MAEVEYLDDSLLNTSVSMKGVDYESIESGGQPSPGQHLAKIKKVKAQKQDWKDYTGAQAVILFTIIDGPDKGKSAYDRIPIEHEKEEDWKKNKRLLVAKRAGFISREDKATVNVNWKLLEGMTFLIELEANDYEDKVTKQIKHGIQLNPFKSYLDPATYKAAGNAGGQTTAGTSKAPAKYADI